MENREPQAMPAELKNRKNLVDSQAPQTSPPAMEKQSSMKRWFMGFLQHTPSFNDMLTGVQDDVDEAQKAQRAAASQAADQSGSKRLTNKQDDWPAFDTKLDIHKVDVADHTRDASKFMDQPKEGKQHSIWEQILRSRHYMSKGKDKTTESTSGRSAPAPNPRVNPEAGPGAVAASPAGPEPVRGVAQASRDMAHKADKSRKEEEDPVRDTLEHFGSE